jgi:C4-dicarboxylate-specific signal transduction histidine kinase
VSTEIRRIASLQVKISMLVAGGGFLLILTLGYALLWRGEVVFKNNFSKEMLASTRVLAHNVAAAAAFEDSQLAEEILNRFSSSPAVKGAELRLSGGRILAKVGESPPVGEADELRIVEVPVVSDGLDIGKLRVLTNFEEALASDRADTVRLLAVAIPVIVAGLVVLFIALQRLVTGPLAEITRVAQLASENHEFSRRLDAGRDDEIGWLASSLNELFAATTNYLEELQQSRRAVQSQLDDLRAEMRRREQAEVELMRTRSEVVSLARQAGMAEMATGILHNIGNVLNSVHISSELMATSLSATQRQSMVQLRKIAEEPPAALNAFFESDPQGRKLRQFLSRYARGEAELMATMDQELQRIRKGIEHLRSIVATQQSFARGRQAIEVIPARDLIDQAILLSEPWIRKGSVICTVRLDYTGEVRGDRTLVLQILINLIRNAVAAVRDVPESRREIIIGSSPSAKDGFACLWVRDNGVGIPPDDFVRIFSIGFTTKNDGHGFGLHSSANSAREMGGSLSVESEGRGAGARFILELPRPSASSMLK